MPQDLAMVGPATTERDPRASFVGWLDGLARQATTALATAARAEGLSGEDAIDAVQDAFAKFCQLPEAARLVGRDDEARAFLYVIVSNTARNMRRRHHRARAHFSFEDAGEPTAPLPSVDELISRAEERARFMRCMRRLAESHRRVVELRVLEELSSKEAAEQLALRPGHVAVLLHRAKLDLLACLDDAGPAAATQA